MIGAVLGDRYRLDAELGRGGMGVVYRAHDTLLMRDVAVKVLSEARLDAEGRARLLREAQAAAQLNHTHIVSVYDAGQADGLPYIVMELVDGRPLFDTTAGDLMEAIPLPEMLGIARQVCAALEHAHAQGIVHRDLKPENVLVTAEGTAKLSDFGLARPIASRLTSKGTIAGTVFYMAPELALGQDLVDGRADLYALGVMLYELSTGRLPFTADEPVAVISQHLHAPVVPPRARQAGIPPALDALIVSLLSKDPRDRPASATEVLRVLESPAALDCEASPERDLSLLERIERGRLVGRERELGTVRDLWNQVLAGQGQVLLISGEQGIGKTRLVREVATLVQVSGGRVLEGANYAEGGVPYGAFAQMLRGVFAGATGGEPDSSTDITMGLPRPVLADLLTLAPALRLYYPDIEANPPLDDPGAERHRLFQSLLTLVTVLSDKAPWLLVLEDIHWADSGTLHLLRYLARHTRHQRVMIVATYREMELDAALPLHEVLLDLGRERLATRVKLPRLDREQTRELLAVLFAEEIRPSFLEGIYRETEGNPFFVEEVCKALVESGKLSYSDGRWHRPSMAELGIPQSVRVAIQSRLRVLPGSTQEVLRLAAVLGREFSFDTLAAATAAAAPDTAGAGAANRQEMLLDALERAEQAQLIEAVSEGEGGTFAFAHGLIPATLVDGLRVMQRRQLHRQAAAAIESRHPDDWEALAHHYSQAGQAEQAVVYLLKAGDRARSLYASQEAAGYYQQALVYLREQGDREGEARTLMKLGLVYTAAFQPDRAREAYDEAFRLWAPLRESREPEAAQAPAAVLRLAEMEPPTLDPGMMGDDTSAFIGAQLFEGLTRVDPEYNVLPAAASHWEILDNGQRYLFRLRPGLHWSDGLPLSAADFEYAWKRSLAMASQSPVAHLLYVVENARALGEGLIDDAGQVGVAALDRQTLEVRLEGPTAYLPHLLAHAVAYPLPRRIVEGPRQPWTDAENLVSNGPYQLAEWRRGDKLVLARNPFYPGQFPGNVDCVECRLFADFGSVLPAYEAGELDAISMINADQGTIARARTAYGSELAFMPQPSIFFLVFRTDQAPFDDVRVRQAFVHAVDRPALAREVWQGQYSPATGGFVPPGMAGHSAGIGLPYDPERAALLLADAGYPDGRGFPEVTWLCSGGSFDNPVIPFLRRAWQRTLGLDLEARSLDWAEFWGELMERRDRDPPHLSSWGWLADYPDPDSLLRVVFHSTEGVHPGHWHHARFDALVEKAGRIAEQPRRMELYREADRILVAEEAAVMPLGYVRGRILVKPWVTVPRVPPVMMRLKDVRVQRPDE